ncbi:FCD domain-containing protein [Paracoccus sp. S-4012]|uniref:GntR family transcriptional regulator n=1 Tax=Paracoccus sp. S-4012 TaxID=2665648 RepID=UPI0012AF41B2|nr:GntR family transcriptional regulator [Paracoccus sp. S-4012]MRX50103.1 FCD domain-containing protein [Paracoccus sp. S-4012]
MRDDAWEAPGRARALGPVRARNTVGDQVHALLRQALLTGRFEPGSLLTVASLAETFATSPMPVREALRRLATEGAVDLRANGSCYVPDATRSRLDDLVGLRLLLETHAARLAATRMDGAAIDALVRLEESHARSAGDWQVEEMLQANADFHFAIYRAAGSTALVPIIESLWLQYGPYMRLLSDHMKAARQPTHEQFVSGHREIVAKLQARDAEGAAAAIADDIHGTRELLDALCAE